MDQHQQSPNNPYDFIINADHKAKRPLLPGSNSKQARIIIVILGLLGLLIAGAVIAAFIASSGNAGKADLTKAAKQQSEIVRISKIGIDHAREPNAQNLAITTNMSMQSDQTALLAALKKQNINLSAKELALAKDSKVDAALTNAEQANKFDAVFTSTIKALLSEYQQTLKKAHDQTSSKTLKAVLAEQYKHAGILTGKPVASPLNN